MVVDKSNYSYQDLKNVLSNYGLKATHQRILILEAFIEASEHPTAEMLYNAAKPKSPSLSLGTVYKTLDAFKEVGLVQKVKTDEDTVRYDAKTDNHHHLFCQKTNRIIDYEDEELEALLRDYFQRKQIDNFEIEDIQLQLNGKIKDQEKDVKVK